MTALYTDWTPSDPTALPTLVAVPRVASALWWPELGVIRVSIRTFERPAARRALDAAILVRGVPPAHLLWVVEDRPYLVPALAGGWTRARSTRSSNGHLRFHWSLCAYAPRMRVSDGVWTWRRTTLEAEREGPIRPDAAMEVEGRAWAAQEGLWWAPTLAAGQTVEPAQLDLAAEARDAKRAS